MADLDELADGLYAQVPAAFVEARKTAVAAAKASGDRAAAAALVGMRKPTVSAWLVNQLVRTAPETVAGALAIGPALRDATRAGDAAALRDLTAHRRTLIGELVRRAAEIAASEGQTFTASMQRDVEGTFTVAATDDPAAAELLTGRLVTPFQTDGLGLDVGPDVPTPARVRDKQENRSTAGAERPTAPVGAPPTSRKPTARAAAEAAARRQEIADAEHDLANARLQAADADAQLHRASAVLDEALAAEAATAAQLKIARARVSDARADVTAATADARATGRAVAAALGRVERASRMA